MRTKLFANFNWPAGTFIIAYHLILLIWLPFYLMKPTISPTMLAANAILCTMNVLGIGIYHRCYSHNAYRLNKFIEGFFLFFSTMTFESSVIKWSHDHRKHHKYLDTESDPYSITRGFWHAHILWIFEKPKPMDMSIVRDLLEDKLLAFQNKYYTPLAIATNLMVIGLVGFLTGNYVGAFVVCFLLRVCVVHHVTWFVNSLAHVWGERTYSRELSAVDNYPLAFLTGGEGYHNYHHTFPSDYRNGVRWYHFDPNKWLVWFLNRLGLATDLKRYSTFTIERQLLKEDRRLLVERYMTLAHTRAQELSARTHELYERMQATLVAMHELMDEIRDRKEHDSLIRHVYREKMRNLKQQLRIDRKSWYAICKEVLGSKMRTA